MELGENKLQEQLTQGSALFYPDIEERAEQATMHALKLMSTSPESISGVAPLWWSI